MIVFRIEPGCRACQQLADDLEALAIAHVITDQASGGQGEPLPPHAMSDDGERCVGHREVDEHIQQLEDLVEHWTLFQSDTCYMDETGKCI